MLRPQGSEECLGAAWHSSNQAACCLVLETAADATGAGALRTETLRLCSFVKPFRSVERRNQNLFVLWCSNTRQDWVLCFKSLGCKTSLDDQGMCTAKMESWAGFYLRNSKHAKV